eukprot:3155942-Prymnesium_polylepis.1
MGDVTPPGETLALTPASRSASTSFRLKTVTPAASGSPIASPGVTVAVTAENTRLLNFSNLVRRFQGRPNRVDISTRPEAGLFERRSVDFVRTSVGLWSDLNQISAESQPNLGLIFVFLSRPNSGSKLGRATSKR